MLPEGEAAFAQMEYAVSRTISEVHDAVARIVRRSGELDEGGGEIVAHRGQARRRWRGGGLAQRLVLVRVAQLNLAV